MAEERALQQVEKGLFMQITCMLLLLLKHTTKKEKKKQGGNVKSLYNYSFYC